MNIAHLLHQTTLQQIPHCSSYVLSDGANQQTWYFHSNSKTLRKKSNNTNIVSFLSSQNSQVLISKQISPAQPLPSNLYKIKTQKCSTKSLLQTPSITSQQIIKLNQLKPQQQQRITLYRIDEPEINQIWSLQWSANIIRCEAPITDCIRSRLSKYCETICKLSENKYASPNQQIKQFQLIFTLDKANTKIKLILAHNFIISHRQLSLSHQLIQMFHTDLKIGRDPYERIQLMLDNKDNQKIEEPFEEQIEAKRLKYLQFVKKLPVHDQEHRTFQIMQKKQWQKETVEQFQCASCSNLVILQEFDSKRLITSNRIPMVRMLRQIKNKMNKKNLHENDKIKDSYEEVAVCQLCYEQFLQAVHDNHKQRVKAKERSSSEVQKQNTKDTINIDTNQNCNNLPKNNFYVPTAKAASTEKQTSCTNSHHYLIPSKPKIRRNSTNVTPHPYRHNSFRSSGAANSLATLQPQNHPNRSLHRQTNLGTRKESMIEDESWDINKDIQLATKQYSGRMERIGKGNPLDKKKMRMFRYLTNARTNI